MMFFFDDPKTIQARRDRERKRFEEVLAPRAVPWDFKRTKIPRLAGEELVFTGFNWGTFVAPPAGDSPTGRFTRRDVAVKRAQRVPFHLRPADSLYSSGANAYLYFTEDLVIPALHEGPQVWMGLSPVEMLTQRSGIQFCRGITVIGGLGIGWFLHEAAQRRQVTRLIVVERERELLDWYGNELCQRYNAEVICDDVWNVVGRINGARYALDIWPGFFDARYDRRLQDARAAGHTIWAWGSPRGAAR